MALLLAAGCAYAWGRGCDCADPARYAGGADRPAAGTAKGPPESVPSRAGSGAKAAPPPPRRHGEAAGTVVRVRDGDSIVVERGGVGTEVRLEGIDCPELAQAFGRKAQRFTADLALGRRVRIIGEGQDRYGRQLAEILLPDGRSLNRELVSAGLAWWFRAHSPDRSLESLEQAARAARRGLWVAPDPMPPWDFRAAGRR